MGAQRGRDLLLKIDLDGDGTFETLGGLRATRIAFDAGTVDVTHMDSAGGWRELMPNAAPKSAAIRGSGIFRDEASDARARQLFWDGRVATIRVVIPHFGIVSGPFQITSLELSGNHDGEATYELALASAGALDFAAL
ncbi:phage major tail protein, TP901-1 family [Jannaschia sp. LMIT008]|uniref:phage major tail protein, TP901-1 family n=1 Tax=Jannaschia maritima TaxID=3032585 RepID=UPI0028117342|nr:phage major tail protein, TP901-1 family [Jannaschia sp. LMIT008]